MNTDRIVHIPLTGEDSHVVSIPVGQGSLSIGTKGISQKDHEVWVEKDQPINWDAFNELYTPYGKQNREILEEIVRTDSKQRYSFNEDGTLIRANQGHFIPVDVELLIAEPPEILWHGTGEKYAASIDKTGLLPQSRLYVHLSGDVDTAITVGKRHEKPVLYRILSGKMAGAGYTFYRSVNGVWLTKTVPAEYLEKQV